MTRVFRLRAAITVAPALLAAAVLAAAYESPPKLKPGQSLPAEKVKGPHHEVLDPIENDGFMNHYRIASDFGRFAAEGRVQLEVRLGEIAALAELAELSKSEVFVKSVGEGVKGTVQGQVETVQNLADKPVETLQGVPQGVGRMFRRYKAQAGEVYEEGKEAHQERQEAKEGGETGAETATQTKDAAADAGSKYAKKYFGVSSAQRRWAQKLGTDPYTSNEVLRAQIASVAKVDAVGKFGVRLLGIPGIPGIQYMSKLNELVWETDPYELKLLNQKKVAALGVDEKTQKAFFENEWLSPTRQTYILQALDQLAGVEGRALYVAQAATVDSETAAWFMSQSVQMLAWYHRQRSPLAAALPGRAAPIARTRDGRVVAAAATDLVAWTEDLASAAKRAREQVVRALPNAKFELLLLGQATPSAKQELEKLGWQVSSDVAAELGKEKAAAASGASR